MSNRKSERQSGFSLLEVVILIVLLSVFVIGSSDIRLLYHRQSLDVMRQTTAVLTVNNTLETLLYLARTQDISDYEKHEKIQLNGHEYEVSSHVTDRDEPRKSIDVTVTVIWGKHDEFTLSSTFYSPLSF